MRLQRSVKGLIHRQKDLLSRSCGVLILSLGRKIGT
jgi:hypothetical protein